MRDAPPSGEHRTGGANTAQAEKLELLGKLAQDEYGGLPTGAATSHLAQTTKRPDWHKFCASNVIPPKYLPDLERISEQNKNLTQADFSVLFMVINTVTDDSNAVLYAANLVVDACRTDCYNWSLCAVTKDPEDNPSQLCCFHAFMRTWQSSSLYDVLGYLVAGLQSYRHALQDPRPLYSAIVDPNRRPMSTVGRLAAIGNLLKDDSLRLDLCCSSTFRGVISHGLLSKTPSEVYHATICLWLLSFSKPVLAIEGPLYIHRSLLRNFVEVLSTCRTEKIVRAAVQCLKNLVQEPWIFEALFHKKIEQTLTLLDYEKWRDVELYDDVKAVSKLVFAQIGEMTNSARYLKELDSGKLFPGPLHTEKFWIENVNCFEENEFGPIQKLTRLLRTSDDPTTLSLALFDLGEFGRLHPTGKRILTKLDAKSVIMDLMNHPSKEVAREALLATQKMMLDNWKVVGGEAQEKHQSRVAA